MLYFIPAWYQQNKWCENEQTWHARRMRTEFDDTVKQIQLFHRSGAYPFQIMLLSFAPNFRHFLHRQSVFHAPYWSCFDAIQEIRRKKATTLSFHNLNWPADIEFIYTPFVVVAMLHGEKYAQILFGEDGNPIEIVMYQNGRIQRRNIYDDRGFVSSTIIYENAIPHHQDYLSEKGIWKLRHFLEDGHVEMNPKAKNFLLVYEGKEHSVEFSRLSYESMEHVIYEVLAAYIKMTKDEDMFCVAMHSMHTKLLYEALKGKKTILSFFENRYDVEMHAEYLDMIRHADYIITDSQDNAQKIQNVMGKSIPYMKDITPFDSRVDFGISQQLNVQKVLVPVDGLGDARFDEVMQVLGEYIPRNDNVQIHLFTRYADYDRKRIILERTRECLAKAGLEEDWATEVSIGAVSENLLDEEAVIPVRFFVDQCVDELSVSKCMREQRIVVDMRTKTEVYLRIAGISVGIPQIVYQETQFVEHGKNGFVIKNMNQIPEVLDYYLDGLKNWNEAMVYSVELGKKYTTQVLIEEWKEVIDFVGRN